ncbi:MAG TPA: transglutaminase domain-containing protein [Planctomycetota bacterium]|nr:transglutaminase domain-containing protein [Planctomycetota bacterium]
MLRSLVLSCCLLAPLAAQDVATADAAFARAGGNRAELERAWREVPDAQRTSLAFLLEHMPDADAKALDAAFLLREVAQAHAARAAVPWGAELSTDLFSNYVLPYAQANEAREDWRTDFAARFLPAVRECRTPGEAGRKLNETIFAALDVHYSTGRARADQAPSSSIAQHKASCTGLSILLADACRACCVPARLVSVRWPHKAGNHTWVEVWDGAAWRFVGADEPDPQGLDRAWFCGDAAKCVEADREHRLWAVSFAATGERFAAGWGRGIELWGTDVSARYAPSGGDDRMHQGDVQDAAKDEALSAQLDRFFAADKARQATFEFDRNLDGELRTTAGDARLRALAFAAFRRSEQKVLQADFAADLVRAGDKQSAYVVKQVGTKPASGWPLVIAMHGGGGVAKQVNDSQWRHMQVYYKDHPEASGYLYCALRAPTDEWNGFYTDYFYPVIERLIRQFVVCGDVDPDRVLAIGYSHGGYGAFAVGPKLPHRFAAVHASASAPTDGETSPVGLHTLAFSFMVGGRDVAYGRRERCEKFEALLVALRQAHPGLYQTTFTLVEGNGHTGLPDRDLLAQLVPKQRVALPKRLYWDPTDGVVHDHYWLHVPEPKRGQHLEARLDAGGLVVETHDVVAGEVWLDARLWDMSKDLTIEVDGAVRIEKPMPSLRVLCATMLQRGDPVLAATWLVELR